jgi:hypothetical protein
MTDLTLDQISVVNDLHAIEHHFNPAPEYGVIHVDVRDQEFIIAYVFGAEFLPLMTQLDLIRHIQPIYETVMFETFFMCGHLIVPIAYSRRANLFVINHPIHLE